MDNKLPSYNESVGFQQAPISGYPHTSYNANYMGPQPNLYYQQQPQIIVQQPGVPNVVVIGGGCPRCHVGTLNEEYGCCAIFLAIFFFPIGILCCLAMRERVCSNCRARF